MAFRSGGRGSVFGSRGSRSRRRTMPHTNTGRRVRFDMRSEPFRGITRDYREALGDAERVWRKLESRSAKRSPARRDAILRHLSVLEGRLDRARQALFEHTRQLAVDPMRTFVKKLDLKDRTDRGAA